MINTLEFDSIELTFDSHKVLSSIYMKCETGKVVGLLGRNGSGKSCMMKVVFGSMPADFISVRFNGERLPGNYISQRLISYLPQENLFPSYITIKKAIQLFKIPVDTIEEDLPEIIEFLPYKPAQLSGGYQRLIEAILILKYPAPFCILDEPFSGLAPLYIEKLISIIQKMKLVKGVIITDHMHRYVTAVADKLCLLANGKIYHIKNQEQLVSLGYISSL
jgi:ABC-type multidrug transport system ATPase subunit